MQTNEGNWYLEAACSKRRSSWKMARRMAWKDKKDKRNGSELQGTVEERCNIYLWETFCAWRYQNMSVHVCTLVFVKLSDLLWTGFSSIFRSVLLLFEVRSQCGYGFSFNQLEVSGQFYPFFDRSPPEMTKKKPKFGTLPKLNMPTKSYERGEPYTTSWTFGCKM